MNFASASTLQNGKWLITFVLSSHDGHRNWLTVMAQVLVVAGADPT